tara:strand:+ start:796 stop:969 length:174 start_codon:yes stop_codon:yes gene_type:complete
MAASWANICVRVWGNTEDNWTVFVKLNKALKEAGDDANILIPFPQHRVHIESDVISK